jgi:hypothetical protein
MSSQRRRGEGWVSVVVLAALLVAFQASAAGDTSMISGTVTIEGGVGLPGASVVATDEERGVSREGVTDGEGFFRIPLLRPGRYTVRAEVQGFAPYQATGHVLLIGKESVLRINLTPAMAETIDVQGAAMVVDPTESQVSNNVTPGQMEALPLATRDYLELAFLAPGAAPSRDVAFKGVVSAGGQEARNTFISVDGADNNNFILGGQMAAISTDAIQEFQIITNNFTAEYGRSNSAVVNVLTKSGANELSGSLSFYRRDDSMAEDSFFPGATNEFERSNWSATLGGPLMRDRAFYFFSYDGLDEERPVQVTTPVAGLNEAVPVTLERTLVMAKADLAISSNQRLALSYRLEDRDDANLLVGGGFTRSYGYAQATRTHGANLSHQWNPSGSIYNEFRISGYRFEQSSIPNSTDVGQRFATYSIGQNPRFPQGGEEKRAGFADTVGWWVERGLLGEHFLKVGVDYSSWSGDVFFNLFQGGQFLFASPNPLQHLFLIGAGDPSTVNDIDFYSAFIQDEWRPISRLTLNLGLRWDYQDGANNSDYVSPYQFLTPAKEESDHFQPRLGFAWDATGDSRVILRGGAGLFYAQIWNNLSLNEDIFNGINFRIIAVPCAAIGGCDVNNPPRSVPGINIPSDIRANAENLTTPYTVHYTLGMASQMDRDFGWTADVVYRRGYHELVEVRENLRSDPSNPNSPRPFPQVASIRRVYSDGESEYKGLLLSARKMFTSRAFAQLSYTYSKAWNETEFFAVAVSDSRAENPVRNDRGPARNDQRHRVVANGAYYLPWDFTVSTILTYGSGQPWNVRLGFDANLDDAVDLDRPAGFTRNSELSDSYFRWDLRLAKAFNFGVTGLELIAEVFNVANTENFDPAFYSNVISAPDFGQPRLSNNQLYQPREFQLAARLTF